MHKLLSQVYFSIVDIPEQLWNFTLDANLVLGIIEIKAKWLSNYKGITLLALVALF